MSLEGIKPLELINFITLILGVAGMLVIFIKLIQRLGRYVNVRGWKRVPLLLWRDTLLFSAFVLLFGGGIIARVFDLTLRDNPFWVIPTDILGLIAIGFWAYVEWFRIEDPKE